MLKTRRRKAFESERGAALILAIIVVFILTLLGISLLFTTSTEMKIAGAETSVNKAFYAADSGAQYGLYQGKQGQIEGSGCGTYTNYWCFVLPEQDVSGTNTISVRVSPLREVDYGDCQFCGKQKGALQEQTRTMHFDSYSTDTNLNAAKQVSVDFTFGPLPPD